MAENVEKRVTVRVGATYTGGSALKSAVADVEKLRKQAELPVMGPLTRDQSAVEAGLKQRIVAMERAGERLRVRERVDEILYGRGGVPAGATQAKALKGIADEAEKAKKPMGELLEIVRKFGTSNGTDTLFEKLTKLAPRVGMVLAATKAISLALVVANRISDTVRHNAQGNIDRQLADEQSWNQTAGTISMGLGPAAVESNFLGAGHINAAGRYALSRTPGVKGFFNGPQPYSLYRDDKIAIENLEDQTKAQDRLTSRMEARAKLGDTLRKSAISEANALRLEFAATTSEYGKFLQYAEKLRQLSIGADTIRRGGGEVPEEMNEAATLLRGGAMGALAADGVGRFGRMLRNYGGRAGAAIGRISDRVTGTRDIDASIRQMRLRDEGRNYEADVGAVRAETARRVTDDPANAAMIREEQAEKESSIARKYHRELLDERRDFQRKMEQTDATAAERRLRLSGKAYEADKLQLANSFQAQAAEIKDRYEAMIRANPSEASTFRERAAREMKSAGEGYSLGLAELMRERAMRYLPEIPGVTRGENRGITGALGEGDRASVRAMDVMNRQLAAALDTANAVRQLPTAIATAVKAAIAPFLPQQKSSGFNW
jgi:hypothetical protein